jgi:hypothetical protein
MNHDMLTAPKSPDQMPLYVALNPCRCKQGSVLTADDV